jgi:hypothetical protein
MKKEQKRIRLLGTFWSCNLSMTPTKMVYFHMDATTGTAIGTHTTNGYAGVVPSCDQGLKEIWASAERKFFVSGN